MNIPFRRLCQIGRTFYDELLALGRQFETPIVVGEIRAFSSSRMKKITIVLLLRVERGMRKLNNYLNRRILLKCCPNNSFVTTGHQIESWPRRKYKFGFVFFLRKFFFKLRRSKISAWQQKANAAIPKYKSQFSQKRAKNIYSLEGMIGSAFITHNS